MGVQRIYLACLLSASSYRDLYAPEVLKGNLFPLQSFYEETTSKKGVVSGLLKDYPKVKMMLDSGAHSFIHKAAEMGIAYDKEGKVVIPDETLDKLPQNIRQLVLKSVGESTNFQGFLKQSASRYVTDYSYFDSKEVKDYLDAYIKWIHEHKDSLHVYVNLDVPFNGQRSWDNQKYMESCGLNPIPVFHFAEDFKWLKKYIDNYEYIGVGGIGQDITKRKYIEQMANPIFKMIKESGQNTKVHGFAVTSMDLIFRYKWFSVDSVVGSSMLLIREHGRIRVETIEELYWLYADNAIRSKSGHLCSLLDSVETFVVNENGVGCWKKVNSVIRHNVSKTTYTVKTRRGRKIQLTGDHGLFCSKVPLPDRNQIECVETKKIQKGDYLVAVDYKEPFGDLTSVTVEIERKTYQTGHGAKTACLTKVPRRVKIDTLFAEFIGLWFADGARTSSSKNSGVGLSVANNKECLDVVETIAKRFNASVGYAQNGVDCCIHSTELMRIMVALGCVGTSKTKEVPWWVFELPEKETGAFLRGYFSGDGTAVGLACGSVSRKLAYGAFHLLCKLGIQTRISDGFDKNCKEIVMNGKKYMASPATTVSIGGVGAMKRFRDKVGFLQQYKMNTVHKDIAAVSEERGLRDKGRENEHYLKVRSVESQGVTKGFVYDLSVEDGEKFVANGLLVHNSTSWLKFAAYGMVIIPVFDKSGKPDYTRPPIAIKFSDRPSEGRKNKAARSMEALSSIELSRVRNYFEERGIDEAKLTESYKARCWANTLFYRGVMDFYRNNDVEPGFDKTQGSFF